MNKILDAICYFLLIAMTYGFTAIFALGAYKIVTIIFGLTFFMIPAAIIWAVIIAFNFAFMYGAGYNRIGDD